jgi:hypothetical protein
LGPADIESVAGWLAFQKRVRPGTESFQEPESERKGSAMRGGERGLVRVQYAADSPADEVESLPTFPPIACWQGRAEDLVLPERLDGFVCFCDPPYKGDITTGGKKPTGYKAGDCSRESVLAMAKDYDKRGAVVAICESVRLDRELGAGWYAVDISHARKGQARTFTKNQGSNSKEPQEWVTLNRPPQYYPPKQSGFAMELQEVPREVVAVEAPRAVIVEAAKEQLSLWGPK